MPSAGATWSRRPASSSNRPTSAVEVADTIEAERFFVLPHPEVADYMALKATDPERWLGGMRKLQRRTIGA